MYFEVLNGISPREREQMLEELYYLISITLRAQSVSYKAWAIVTYRYLIFASSIFAKFLLILILIGQNLFYVSVSLFFFVGRCWAEFMLCIYWDPTTLSFFHNRDLIIFFRLDRWCFQPWIKYQLGRKVRSKLQEFSLRPQKYFIAS